MHEPTWDPAVEPFHYLEFAPGLLDGQWRRLSRADYPALENLPDELVVEPIQWLDGEPEPTLEEADLLFPAPYIDGDLKTMTPLAVIASTALPSASPYYRVLFSTKPEQRKLEARRGNRYQAMLQSVGWSSHFLAGLDGVTPQGLWALWARRIQHFEEQDCDDPPLSVLWRLVCDFYAKDYAVHRTKALKKVELERQQVDLVDRIVAGMREWCEPMRSMDIMQARAYAKRHLIVAVAGRPALFLMNEHGRYGRMPLSREQLIPAMTARGMHGDGFISLRDDDGNWRSANDLINNFATLVSEVRYSVGVSGSYVTDIDTDQASLTLGCYKLRTDIEPRFDADVDRWLRYLVGWTNPEDQVGRFRHERFCQWIGHALAFEEGALPLLSLSGAPDSGKKMVVVGLAECLEDAAYADSDALFGEYGDDLLRSPFVWLDEGWATRNKKHPVDRIREVIGAPALKINRKFLAVSDLRTNVRVIVTANNRDVIAQFAAGRDLDAFSAAAVAQRLMHFDIPHECADFLRSSGGMTFTSSPGRRWIAPQGVHGHSDYVVARHFLYLHRQLGWGTEHPPIIKGRFLMDGGDDHAIMTEMRAQSGTSPWVIGTLLMMLREIPAWANVPKRLNKIAFLPDRWKGVRMFILAGALTEYAQNSDVLQRSKIPNPRAIASAMQLLDKPCDVRDFHPSDISPCSDERITLQCRKELGAQRWRMVDTHLLWRIAQSWQQPCPLLDQLMEGAKILPLPERAASGATKPETAEGVA